MQAERTAVNGFGHSEASKASWAARKTLQAQIDRNAPAHTVGLAEIGTETKEIAGKTVLTGKPSDGIMITDKQFGKKTGKHAADYGLDPGKSEDRETLLGIVKDIIDNADEIRVGFWQGREEDEKSPAVFYVKGSDVVITRNNEFVSIMKGGKNNAKVQRALVQ